MGWESPSVIDIQVCGECKIAPGLTGVKRVPGKEGKLEEFLRTSVSKAPMGNPKDARMEDSSLQEAYRMVAALRRFAVRRLGVYAYPPPLSPEVLEGYVRETMDFVQPATIRKTVEWAASRWTKLYNAVMTEAQRCKDAGMRVQWRDLSTLPDPSKAPAVQEALALADKEGFNPREDGGKAKKPVPIKAVKAYIRRRRRKAKKGKSVKWTSYVLAATSLLFSFIRRSRLARVQFRGKRGKPSRKSEVVFLQAPDKSQAVLLTASREKNQKRRVRTTRVIGDDNVVGLEAASLLKETIQEARWTDGPLLRKKAKRDGKWMPWGDKEWSEFLDDFAATTGVKRETLGAQSFRSAYAQALKEAGLGEEELQALGYWWSGASHEYSGEAVAIRLDMQKPAARRKFRGAKALSKGSGSKRPRGASRTRS